MTMTEQAQTTALARARTWFVIGRGWIEKFPLSLIQLGIRFGLGAIFFNSGLIKLHSFEFAVKLFEQEYQLPVIDPAIAARLAMMNELTWPIFLFLGLATRFAAIPLLGMTAVIFSIYPGAWNESLLWASALAVLITRGGGVFSVDWLIERYAFKR